MYYLQKVWLLYSLLMKILLTIFLILEQYDTIIHTFWNLVQYYLKNYYILGIKYNVDYIAVVKV